MKKIWVAILALQAINIFAADLVWPTESLEFAKGMPIESFIQPPAGSEVKAGLFGDVRNNGYRFHEGIDIKATRRAKSGEALDEVYAVMDGTVRLVNTTSGYSNYGRYVVLEHTDLDVPVYTLYAHLASVENDIKSGSKIKAGTKIGILGRSSAGYKINKPEAHLHFEVGLRYSDNFQPWYEAQKFGSPNYFANFNGMNLAGFDALQLFAASKEGKLKNFKDYIQSLPTAYVVRIYTKDTPDFVKRYPALVDENGQKVGWDVHFTWFGLPQKFERIKDPKKGARYGDVEVIKHNPDEMKRKCRRLVVLDSKGNVVITNDMKEVLHLLF